jgi:uncharacterized protein (DUF1810 family)
MTTTTTTPDVTRFKRAQDKVWRHVAHELATGRKQTHWMWFVFPQHRGLAKSEMAQRYGIRDEAEALAYLDNEVLRIRLASATMAVLKQKQLMFGDTDRKKLRSCMTLFRGLVTDPTLPDAVLAKFYDGEQCPLTLDLLAGRPIPVQWVKPAPWTPNWGPGDTAMGRVETRETRRWDRQINRARATVERAQAPLWDDPEPMSHREIMSYVKSFGLSAIATQQLVDRWMEDQNRAAEQGWNARDAEY